MKKSRRPHAGTHRFYRVGPWKTPPYGKCGQNRKMVWHFYGKTKTAITSSKNQFRPQFWAQIVAGVETHPYSPFLGPGDHFFWAKLWGKPGSENFLQGFTIRFWKKRNRHLYQDFWFCQTNSTITSVWWLEVMRRAGFSWFTSRWT